MIESTNRFWETTYRRNIAKMIGICYRYTVNQQLAEDLAHDAFLKAIDKSASFEGKGSFDAWLRRIVVNHVLQYLRDQKKEKHFDDWMQHESLVLEIEDVHFDASPIEQVDFSESELLDAIHDLPEHHRLVFNLYVMDQFTHVQIGETLGISPGTSKSHLARARKKLQQLLVRKANEKRHEKDRRRRLLLFFFPYKSTNIDDLYLRRLHNLEMVPKKGLSIDLIDFREVSIPMLQAGTFTSWNYIVGIGAIGTISVVIFLVFNSILGKDETITESLTKPAVYDEEQDLDSMIKTDNESRISKVGEKVNANDDDQNNSKDIDSTTATIFTDSVILTRNIKNKSMRSLDSLGAMLLMSSSLIFDSIGQPNEKATNEFQRKNKSQFLTENNQFKDVDQLKTKTMSAGNKSEDGTFYASKLFWSGKNNELYLKGKVRVDFGENNFSGDGIFTFLGPVYFLVFNGEPVTLDATIELSKQLYRLTTLKNKEAIKKYGEKGRQGAVEISVIE